MLRKIHELVVASFPSNKMHKLGRFQTVIKDFIQRVSTNKTASSTRIDDQVVVVNALNESIDAMSISVGKGTVKTAEKDVLWQ